MNIKHRVTQNHILAHSIGVVYLWFGMLKFFPVASPAESLAKDTISILTFNLLSPNISIILLASWETAVGLLLILNIRRKMVVIMALIHISLTFSPLFFLSNQVFGSTPFHLSFLGQYIFKNLVIIAGLVTLYKLAIKERQLT